ncbi:hypothetical protein [Fortiea contorta]|nr:hypothetical protein [Fortiea contorta]
MSLTGEILPGWNIFDYYACTHTRITKDKELFLGSFKLGDNESDR